MTEVLAAPVRARQINRVWLALPYAMVALSAMLTWGADDLTTGEVPWSIGASLAVVLWHSWWAVAHQHWLEVRLTPMAVYYLGLVGLSASLFHLSFNFFPLILVCFALAFVALPGRWAYAGVAVSVLAVLLAPGQLSGSAQSVMTTVAGGLLTAAAGWSIRALESETAQRRAAMVELARAHADLQRLLEQNRALLDQVAAEARESGVVAERSRLAGEIHDTLAAGLTGILGQLETLDARLRDDGHPLRPRVTMATELARETLQEARRSVRALRPKLLVEGSLPEVLADTAGTVERTRGLTVELRIIGRAVTVPDAAEDALVRIAQEALANVHRHSGATGAHLTLSFLGEVVALDIADDGTGFEPSELGGEVRGEGHGIAIMRDRAATLGGTFDLVATPETGTIVTVTVPLHEASAVRH